MNNIKSRISGILKYNKNLMVYSLVIFVISIFLGFISYENLAEKVPSIIKNAFSGVIVKDSQFMTFINIMIRNLWITFITIILGITVIAPVLILFSNGFVAGLILMYVSSKGITVSKMILGVVPHAIFEIPAFVITSAVGMRIGLSIFSKGKRIESIIKSLKDATIVYLTIIIPLVIIAAFVETYISAATFT